MIVTKKFQDVLTTRLKNVKAHENRKQLFSTVVSREQPLKKPTSSVVEPTPMVNLAWHIRRKSAIIRISRKWCWSWQPTKVCSHFSYFRLGIYNSPHTFVMCIDVLCVSLSVIATLVYAAVAQAIQYE